MSSVYDNGGLLGRSFSITDSTTTGFADEINTSANCEVIETRSANFSNFDGGSDDFGFSLAETTLSSTLQEGDIIVVQMFLDVGNASGLIDSGSSWAYPSGFPSGSSENISNINTLLAYKVVTSGNETLDATIGFNQSDDRGGVAIMVIRGGTVSSSAGGAVDIQANYNAAPTDSSISFPSLSGAPSGSVALLFAFLDDDNSSISSAPSGYTTAEDFFAGYSAGNGGRFYAGYQENVTATGSPSITFSSTDSIIGVSLLISRNLAGKTAKRNSGVWNTQASYDNLSFDAVSPTTRSVTPIEVTGMAQEYLGESNTSSNTISVTISSSYNTNYQGETIALVHAESNTGVISAPSVSLSYEPKIVYNGTQYANTGTGTAGTGTVSFNNLDIGPPEGILTKSLVLGLLVEWRELRAVTGPNSVWPQISINGTTLTSSFPNEGLILEDRASSSDEFTLSVWHIGENSSATVYNHIKNGTANVEITSNDIADNSILSCRIFCWSGYGYVQGADANFESFVSLDNANTEIIISDSQLGGTGVLHGGPAGAIAIAWADEPTPAYSFSSNDATIVTDAQGTDTKIEVGGESTQYIAIHMEGLPTGNTTLSNGADVAGGDSTAIIAFSPKLVSPYNTYSADFEQADTTYSYSANTPISIDASVIGGSSNNIHAGIYNLGAAGVGATIGIHYDADIDNAGLQVYHVSNAMVQSTGSTDVPYGPSLVTSNAVSGNTGSGLSATLNGITTNNSVILVSGYMDHSNTSTNSAFSTTSGTLTEIRSIWNDNNIVTDGYNYSANSNLGQGDFAIVANPVHAATINYTSDIADPQGVLASVVYGVSQESASAAVVTPAAEFNQLVGTDIPEKASLTYLSSVTNTAIVSSTITMNNVNTGTNGEFYHFVIVYNGFATTGGTLYPLCYVDGGSALPVSFNQISLGASSAYHKQFVWIVPSINQATANVVIDVRRTSAPAETVTFYNLNAESANVVSSNTAGSTSLVTSRSRDIGTTTDINSTLMMVTTQNDNDTTNGETFVNGSAQSVTFTEDVDIDFYTDDRSIFYHSNLSSPANSGDVHTFTFGNQLSVKTVSIVGFE